MNEPCWFSRELLQKFLQGFSFNFALFQTSQICLFLLITFGMDRKKYNNRCMREQFGLIIVDRSIFWNKFGPKIAPPVKLP